MTERVYQEGGILAHVAESGESPARCGKDPWPSRWLGVNNYSEKTLAHALTLCMGCVQAIRNGSK